MHVLKLMWFWVCYWFPFIPAVPAFGKREDADCVYAQAFGRNSLSDDELGATLYRLRTEVDMDDWQAFTLLAYRGFDPGKSNRAIARYCKRAVRERRIALIGQWEVMYAIWDEDPAWYYDHRELLDIVWPPREGYFATRHVKLLSRECMHKRGCSRPLEVAHPAMVTRAVSVIWALGVTPIVEPVKPFRFHRHELWVWDGDSVQGWTRRFRSWVIRELAGRAHHLLVGWLALTPPETV
ncbi:MAG TPA: hypothetical protein VD862_00035 [Candidatus Paceibacterota bacterium]|nr:hypothetical protein [Candidatus Paceibacterota bacterium]